MDYGSLTIEARLQEVRSKTARSKSKFDYFATIIFLVAAFLPAASKE